MIGALIVISLLLALSSVEENVDSSANSCLVLLKVLSHWTTEEFILFTSILIWGGVFEFENI